jgi:hypothetical protein
MLYDAFSETQIHRIAPSRVASYQAWCAALNQQFPGRLQLIIDQINAYIDQHNYFEAGFIPGHFGAPGSDWAGTDFQALYESVGDETLAKYFLGLIVETVVINRGDEWLAKFPPRTNPDEEATQYFQRVPAPEVV